MKGKLWSSFVTMQKKKKKKTECVDNEPWIFFLFSFPLFCHLWSAWHSPKLEDWQSFLFNNHSRKLKKHSLFSSVNRESLTLKKYIYICLIVFTEINTLGTPCRLMNMHWVNYKGCYHCHLWLLASGRWKLKHTRIFLTVNMISLFWLPHQPTLFKVGQTSKGCQNKASK